MHHGYVIYVSLITWLTAICQHPVLQNHHSSLCNYQISGVDTLRPCKYSASIESFAKNFSMHEWIFSNHYYSMLMVISYSPDFFCHVLVGILWGRTVVPRPFVSSVIYNQYALMDIYFIPWVITYNVVQVIPTVSNRSTVFDSCALHPVPLLLSPSLISDTTICCRLILYFPYTNSGINQFYKEPWIL